VSLLPHAAAGADAIDRPIIILSAPRSGSTLLFETLSRAPGVYTIGNESHRVIEGLPELNAELRGFESNRLVASDASGDVAVRVRSRFASLLRDRHGIPPAPGQSLRFLEKTPKNILRVPFMRTLFPDARLVVLFRDPRAVLSSMMEAWRSGHFVTYRRLPDWKGLPWSLLLVDDWQQVNGRPLEEVVAHQWARGMSVLMDDLDTLHPSEWIPMRYEDLVSDPQEQIRRLCLALGLGWDMAIRGLPNSKVTLSPPDPEKWRRNEAAILRVMPLVEQVQARAERMLGGRGQS
jgi:Sulfotransferase family